MKSSRPFPSLPVRKAIRRLYVLLARGAQYCLSRHAIQRLERRGTRFALAHEMIAPIERQRFAAGETSPRRRTRRTSEQLRSVLAPLSVMGKATNIALTASPYCSGALLLLAIASLSTSCGGGGDAGFAQSDNSATLTWDASESPDVIGYRIYYGTVPGTYSQVAEAGHGTTYTVSGLSRATTYYFVATAYSSWTNESAFSNEVAKTIP